MRSLNKAVYVPRDGDGVSVWRQHRRVRRARVLRSGHRRRAVVDRLLAGPVVADEVGQVASVVGGAQLCHQLGNGKNACGWLRKIQAALVRSTSSILFLLSPSPQSPKRDLEANPNLQASINLQK